MIALQLSPKAETDLEEIGDGARNIPRTWQP
jgi:hypothetical protein